MVAVLTTEFWLSVLIPATASVALIVGGVARRRGWLIALGILGLLLAAGWLVLGLRVEAVIE